ncbi:hypothetical protein BESB_064560 [Besnoitia besnoiti]|uniref:GAF domain-containing protein n=1 Tax=Besnoitia besnoiti TaxID=94643 RepID=A0A2A9M8W9_BESBE|nr:hypothetical protein BESB_064560 [Besnoitia besnoiti]PFH34425.1 hypothetical protein BESB_064560 [Besnoitia besnoiti]
MGRDICEPDRVGEEIRQTSEHSHFRKANGRVESRLERSSEEERNAGDAETPRARDIRAEGRMQLSTGEAEGGRQARTSAGRTCDLDSHGSVEEAKHFAGRGKKGGQELLIRSDEPSSDVDPADGASDLAESCEKTASWNMGGIRSLDCSGATLQFDGNDEEGDAVNPPESLSEGGREGKAAAAHPHRCEWPFAPPSLSARDYDGMSTCHTHTRGRGRPLQQESASEAKLQTLVSRVGALQDALESSRKTIAAQKATIDMQQQEIEQLGSAVATLNSQASLRSRIGGSSDSAVAQVLNSQFIRIHRCRRWKLSLAAATAQALTISPRTLLNSLKEEEKARLHTPRDGWEPQKHLSPGFKLPAEERDAGERKAKKPGNPTKTQGSASIAPEETVTIWDGVPPDEEADDAQGLAETFAVEGVHILETILEIEIRRHRTRRSFGAVVVELETQATLFQQLCFRIAKEALVFFLVTRNVRLLNGPKEFVPQWLQILTDILEVERATIFLWDATRGELYSRCASGGLSNAIRLKSGSGIASLVYATGKPLIVEKPYSHPRFNPVIDKRTAFRTRNICCVPLHLGDKVVGCIQLLNKLHGLDFLAEDMHSLQTLSDYVAHAFVYSPFIDDGLLSEKADAWTAHALQSMAPNEPLRSPGTNPVLHCLVSAIARALEAEHCSLWMAAPGSPTLTLEATTLLEELTNNPRPRSGIATRVMDFGARVNIVDAARDIRFDADLESPVPQRVKTMACLPLARASQDVDEQPKGCIQLFNKECGVFTAADLQKLQAFEQVLSGLYEGGCRVLSLSCSVSHMKHIFSSLPLAAFLVDRRGIVIQVNQEAGWLLKKLSSHKKCAASALGVVRSASLRL